MNSNHKTQKHPEVITVIPCSPLIRARHGSRTTSGGFRSCAAGCCDRRQCQSDYETATVLGASVANLEDLSLSVSWLVIVAENRRLEAHRGVDCKAVVLQIKNGAFASEGLRVDLVTSSLILFQGVWKGYFQCRCFA
jgi:hypothetical protein